MSISEVTLTRTLTLTLILTLTQNILIMHDGVLKLCDLSFAAFISDSRYFEQAGQRLAIAPGRFFNFSGTWQYHAPEMLDISDSIDKATGFPITRMAR